MKMEILLAFFTLKNLIVFVTTFAVVYPFGRLLARRIERGEMPPASDDKSIPHEPTTPHKQA